MQSRAHSALEAGANVAVGYGVAVVANMLIMPAFGYAVTAAHAAGMGVLFTVVSLVRSYALRRVFNAVTARHAAAQRARESAAAAVFSGYVPAPATPPRCDADVAVHYIGGDERRVSTCSYPRCTCPFDAPEQPASSGGAWCARGLPAPGGGA